MRCFCRLRRDWAFADCLSRRRTMCSLIWKAIRSLANGDCNICSGLRSTMRAMNCEEEKKGFEWLVDEVMRRREANPKMHVYHFGGYEPAALKRLMGMYVTREDEIDRILRAGVLVDLHQTFKQGVRASVEEYSLKKIEAFYGFERKTPLDQSRQAMRYIEHRLELGWGEEAMPEQIREAMEGYNADDCFSAAKLRDWVEEERSKLVKGATDVPRFVDREEEGSEELDERQKRVVALVEELTAGIPADSK